MNATHTSPAAGRNRDPETIDIIDNLQRTSGQLASLLALITANGTDHFRRMTPTVQDHILDLCDDHANRILEAANNL